MRVPHYSSPSVVPPGSATGRQLEAVGQGLQNFGSSLVGVAGQLQDQLDDARISGSDALFSDAIREEETAFRAMVGRDAVDNRQATLEKIKEKRKAIESGLQNDVQRGIFAQRADRRMQDVIQSVDGHVRHQAKAYEMGETKASLEAAVADFGAAWQNPEAAALHKRIAIDRANDVARQVGAGPEQTKALVLDTTTRLHAGVLDQLVASGRAEQARAYLDAAKGEMDPGKLADAQRLVQRASIQDESLRLSLEIIGVAKGQGGASIADQERYAVQTAEHTFRGKKISAEVHDATVNRLRAHYRAEDQFDAEQSRQLLLQADQWSLQNPLMGLSAMPTQLYADLEKRGLLGKVEKVATTDPQAFVAAGRLTDEQLRQFTPERIYVSLRGKVPESEIQTVLARRERALGKATPDTTHILSVDEIVKRGARQLGILPADQTEKPSAAQLEKFAEWQVQLNADLQQWQADNKKKAQPEDIQKILDQRVMNTVQVPTGGWLVPLPGFGSPMRMVGAGSETKRVDQLTPAEQETAFVDVNGERVRLTDVPPQDREEIIEDLKARGQQPSQRAIVEAWVRNYRPQRGRWTMPPGSVWGG